MHNAYAGGLEIVIALTFSVRIDEELHAGILVHVPAEIHFPCGGALLQHIEAQDKVAAGMESAEHYTRFVWGHFRPIAAVEHNRLALRDGEEERGRIESVNIQMFDYHNFRIIIRGS